MAQNSQLLAWTSQEVDAKLKGIMAECYKVCSFFFFKKKKKIPFLFPFLIHLFLLDMFERRI